MKRIAGYLAVIGILLLISTACRPERADTAAAPADTAAAESLRNGTHIICEGGKSCTWANGCPQGYDEFMAQVGPACVKHYGREEISAWPACRRSTGSCSCVYAERDTRGDALQWSDEKDSLRCAPHGYRDYMVNGGLSGVDKLGMEYQMIA